MTGKFAMRELSFREEIMEMADAWNLAPKTIEVIAYRPERRVTFRAGRPGTDSNHVFKIMKAKHAARLALVLTHLSEEPSDEGWIFPVPVLRSNRWVEIEFLEGTSLFDARDRLPELAGPLGSLLASLHGITPPPLRTHGVSDECDVVRRAARGAEEQNPEIAAAIRTRLGELETPDGLEGRGKHVFLHRDFYDKQILICDDRFALIDWDCAAIGPAAIDAANFATHVTLRHLQGRLDAATARIARTRFLTRYLAASDAVDPGDITYFETLATLRLAGVYASRALQSDIAGKLLALTEGAIA